MCADLSGIKPFPHLAKDSFCVSLNLEAKKIAGLEKGLEKQYQAGVIA